jgi:hypothetical protein
VNRLRLFYLLSRFDLAAARSPVRMRAKTRNRHKTEIIINQRSNIAIVFCHQPRVPLELTNRVLVAGPLLQMASSGTMPSSSAVSTMEELKLSTRLSAPVEGLGFYPGPAGPSNAFVIGAIWDRGNSPFDRAGCIANDVVVSINGIPVDASLLAETGRLYAICKQQTDRFDVVVRRDVAKEEANRRSTYGELGVNTEMGTPLSDRCALCNCRLVEDVGQWRWHCTDCPYRLTDLCETCFEGKYRRDPPAVTSLAIAAHHMRVDGTTADRTPHDMERHVMVHENAGPVSLRLQVAGARPLISLNNALLSYARRPLFGHIKDDGKVCCAHRICGTCCNAG